MIIQGGIKENKKNKHNLSTDGTTVIRSSSKVAYIRSKKAKSKIHFPASDS